MKSYFLLILGMMAVTFVPRLIPLMTFSKREIHPLLRRYLLYIPYAALSALIVRGVLDSEHKLLTGIGIGVAALCAWFKGGMVISVLAAIGATFIMLYFKLI